MGHRPRGSGTWTLAVHHERTMEGGVDYAGGVGGDSDAFLAPTVETLFVPGIPNPAHSCIYHP